MLGVCPLAFSPLLLTIVMQAATQNSQIPVGYQPPDEPSRPVESATAPAGDEQRPVSDVTPNPISEEPDKHIFGVLPNYATVKDSDQVPPIRTSQMFRYAALDSFDPYVFPFVAGVAELNQLRKEEPSWGFGKAGYARRYSTALADNSIGNFLTTAVLPSTLHQDPRYYELGTGGFWYRLRYAGTRSIITRGANGRPQFNVSDIGGNTIAATLSNLYYPGEERTVGATIERAGFQILYDSSANILKEFWPDIHRFLQRH